MDIDIYNIQSYLNYLIDNNLSFNDNELLNLIGKISLHNYIDKSLYNNFKDDIKNNNRGNIINNLLPKFEKEFNAIDSCVVTKLLDYMETKAELTSFVVNHDIINKKKYNTNLNKIGEYTELLLDNFIKNNINKDFQSTNVSTLIKTYKPKALKKGGLVLRNLFKDIEKYLNEFNKQDYYKFSKKIIFLNTLKFLQLQIVQ